MELRHCLPPFLVARIRLDFRQCAIQHRAAVFRRFGTVPFHQFGASPSYNLHLNDQRTQRRSSTEDAQHSPDDTATIAESSNNEAQSRELVPTGKGGRAVGGRRTVDAPMKIIPKAEVTPNLKLTPKQRLHIEILTRRAPPVVRRVKPYKERLLVYHHGNVKENASIFLKVLGLVCAGAVSCVVVPAHYMAGTSLWLCGTLLVLGWFPSIFFHYLTKLNVTRIQLRLPPNARVSPEAAMKYAKSLPATAQLDMSFTRISALPGTVTVSMADLQPIPKSAQRRWRPSNLQWVGGHVDKGTWVRPNPVEFFVGPEVGPGRARRDVIPGLWTEIYNRLMNSKSEPVSRWQRK